MIARVTSPIPVLLSFFLLVAPGSTGWAQEAKEKSKPIVPILEKCTLSLGNQVLKPSRISDEFLMWRKVGERQIAVENNRIRSFGRDLSKPDWTAAPIEGIDPVWISGIGEVGYLAGLKKAMPTSGEISEKPLILRRINLKSGKWLEPFPIDPDPKYQGDLFHEEIMDVVAEGADVVVMTRIQKKDNTSDTVEFVINRVIGFKDGKKTWMQTFKSSGDLPDMGVRLWAARGPESAQLNVKPLALLPLKTGSCVLACGGPLDPVHCFEIQTGKENWSLSRVWEYRRGFTGPSVWSHHLSRFGRELFQEKDGKEEEKTKKGNEPNKNEVNYLLGGPIVVPQNEGDPRIFLATGTAPKDYWTYLTEGTVYEIDDGGRPIARASLPRLIQGWRSQIVDGGVVWSCVGGGLVKINPSKQRFGFFGGPGGPDCLAEIDWYRQLPVRTQQAWLTTSPAGDPLTFSSDLAFRVRTGGYVKDSKECIFRFPIAMVDIRSGQDSSLLLSVPFEGEFPVPNNNFMKTTHADRSSTFATIGPYQISITSLRARSGQLDVTLGMENWHRTLSFELPVPNGK